VHLVGFIIKKLTIQLF